MLPSVLVRDLSCLLHEEYTLHVFNGAFDKNGLKPVILSNFYIVKIYIINSLFFKSYLHYMVLF